MQNTSPLAAHGRARSRRLPASVTEHASILDWLPFNVQATLNVLEAGRRKGAKHFVLLSAICVQKPTLTFQKAKLKFEAALQARTVADCLLAKRQPVIGGLSPGCSAQT